VTAGLPLRVAAFVPNPREAIGDGEGTWQALARAIRPFEGQGLVSLERLTPPTEQTLRRRLAAGPCHVLHFVGQAIWRPAAQYGALVFEATDGSGRSVTTKYLAAMLAAHPDLAVVVLQMHVQAGGVSSTSGAVLWDGGPGVILGPALDGVAQEAFAAALYAALSRGATLQEATNDASRAIASTGTAADLRLVSGSPDARLVGTAPAVAHVTAPVSPPAAASHPPAALSPADLVQRVHAAEREAARIATLRELERKRGASSFDVFLCHNRADKPAIRRIADQLEALGILPWLDERELPPGQPWQPLLERQMAGIRSAAVFVGAAGVGPWQEQELYGFLREFVSRRSPVIPVLLPDAPDTPELPIFLRAMTWVDFRVPEPDPLARLAWGITGRRPDRL
jgi:hypothetical protein